MVECLGRVLGTGGVGGLGVQGLGGGIGRRDWEDTKKRDSSHVMPQSPSWNGRVGKEGEIFFKKVLRP